MSELTMLVSQRDEILDKIREIEEDCEGIENENNAERVQILNLEQAQLLAQKKELSAKLNALNSKISTVNSEIEKLSGTGIDRILEAIKNQRWYFFKNKPKILMDRNTGLLWANLDYYNICADENMNCHLYNEDFSVVKKYDFDGFIDWNLPTRSECIQMINDRSFPFWNRDEYYIRDQKGNSRRFFRILDFENSAIDFYSCSLYQHNTHDSCWLPRTDILIQNFDYESNISPNNPVYTEKERLHFTLDLFVQNDLWPIFDDDEITQLYKKIYFEKPQLLAQLQELQTQIKALQEITLLSSEFDYTVLLSKYDISSIDSSVIKYYQAVQKWTDELMEKLDYYEKEKESVIRDFNIISLQLSKKYEQNPNLTEEENALLKERQRYFQKKFSLGMNSIKSKILAIKKQADELEYRIDEIDSGENAIHDLAVLEKEERAGFAFLAENTAKIIKNALLKIEYFEAHHQFVTAAVQIWSDWSENYRVFKTTYKEDLKNACEEDGIEEEVWIKWYENWQSVRFAIEQKIQPLIERGLKADIPTENQSEKTVVEQMISILTEYKDNIDKFFMEERKGIYQKFAFQAGGELQDKFEAESGLYRHTSQFQTALQEVIFNCSKAEDRVFILNWANSLLDIQIDEILTFVADNDLQKVSKSILEEFAALKQKNYDAYLSDAKAYGEEKAAREKQYNSLVFKMRKDLMK